MRILFHLKVSGKENIPSPPYLIVPNHSSLVDPPLVGMAFKQNDVSFLAKEALFATPLIRFWSTSVGCIEVKRGTHSVKSLKEALKRIKEGKAVCIFPEGTRSIDGSFQEAKRGVGFLIAKAAVPVVPVYIEGSQKALPKTGGATLGSEISIRIGKAISPEEFLKQKTTGKTDYEKITGIAMNAIANLKEDVLKDGKS